MFIKYFLTPLLILLYSTLCYAQEVYVCESYSENGKPIGVKNKFEIQPYGKAVYILIDNENNFDDPLLYMFVDKLSDNKFIPFDSKTITVDEQSTWAVSNFEFSEPGIYEIYFLNSSQNRLASIQIETYYADEFNNQIVSPSYSYDGDCELVFCELVINGKPVNQFSTISLSNFGGQVFIYLNNKVPFNIDRFQIQVWKRSQVNSNYEELIDSKKFRILPEWRDAFFRYIFTQVGDFKIDVFDRDNNFIASNILTVQN